ncbi:CLUMA_CG000797, isoform A [Clunio marinus]|uniref:CLUMA_CG000797, isoform A n=1 Tax=Clunio marinus TaxID=568069 RepID=A0A1J1HG60_9DIPT|nr:CLUMA_CG000797, isoform A [Clunio marinus]
MSMPSRLALASIDIGSAGINSPSIVGADGKPSMPEYEFHCCTEIVLASTERMQFKTARGDS